jgi:hypothetical protein
MAEAAMKGPEPAAAADAAPGEESFPFANNWPAATTTTATTTTSTASTGEEAPAAEGKRQDKDDEDGGGAGDDNDDDKDKKGEEKGEKREGEGEEELGEYEGGPAPKKKQRAARQYTMRSDLEEMMFGFGDVWPPKPSSVSLLEAIATNYIEDLSTRAVQVSEMRGKLDKECFLYVVRKDRRLFNRAARLLKAHEEIKSAQKETLKEEAT